MSIQSKLSHFFKMIFPSTFVELGIFIFFLAAYGIFGTFLAQHYKIVFDSRIPWDAYFSFDNKAIVMTGGSFERHPLSWYFFNWIREFIFLFTNGKMGMEFRLFLVWISNFIVSLSIVQVYKYLKNIVQTPLFINLLLVLFFGLFSTCILLSFTPETYTYTLLLLTAFNYYSAVKLKNDGKISGLSLVLGSTVVGGLTVTNIVKIFIPVLFEKELFKSWKKFGFAALRVGISCVVFVLLYLNRINFKYENILSKSGEQYEKFSNVNSTPVWDMIYSYFFGGNILFPSFFIREKHNMQGFYYKALFMDVYTSAVPYIFIGLLLLLIFWSYFRNFKNKLVQILMISFAVDIAIHCVFRFGLHTSYIYGGHFVFVYPMILGWLFFIYRSQPKTLSFLACSIFIMTLYLGLNNFYRMTEFFDFVNRYY
ncbi:hypothetical protein IC610_10980 [Chryseobacterium sp. GCR10]|uniref:Glycosyltransferase RgtA/B/C/D-like domain-containing protein n=2 Tax=Chryseobacterium caseinilyticum TaxID=2771428 RepID=A0ABR8ZC96_9FLAO|nr:hypothetical protein [Chryseobacterium caseinilyticum]